MDLKDYRIDLWRFVLAFSHHVLERNRMKRLTCPDCEEAKKFKWIQLQNYVNYCKNKHMPLNGLAERELEISLDGQSHKVKAMAVFTVHNVAPEETGLYHLDFTVGGLTAGLLKWVQRKIDAVVDRRQVIQPCGSIGVADGDEVSVTILLINRHDLG
jgi:hypothetical protein